MNVTLSLQKAMRQSNLFAVPFLLPEVLTLRQALGGRDGYAYPQGMLKISVEVLDIISEDSILLSSVRVFLSDAKPKRHCCNLVVILYVERELEQLM